MILSLVSVFLSLHQTPLHAVSPRPLLSLQRNLPWEGHFSARNFGSTKTDQLRLSFVKEHIRETILALPKWHTDALDNLEIRNETHVSRGLSSGEKIILHTSSISSTDELQSVFVHELGHIVDLGALEGTEGRRTAFQDGNIPILSDDLSLEFYRLSWTSAKVKKRSTQRLDFVSGYAQTDCFEDFAETYTFYRLHGEKFRALIQNSTILQQKYDFMQTHVFDDQEFGMEKEETALTAFFDTTLLPIDELAPLKER